MLIGNPSLVQLLLSVREGEVVLPDIQRSFVWDPDQMYLFCDSLFRGYPFGSFLFWRVVGRGDPDTTLVYRKFLDHYSDKMKLNPGVELAPGEEKLLVLDGQQRLQSLYLCLFGNYERKDLYLDVMTGQHEYDRSHDLKYYVRFFKQDELKKFRSLPAGHGRRMIRIKDFIELDDEQRDSYATRKIREFDIGDQESRKGERMIRRVWAALRSPGRVQIHTIDANVHDIADSTSLTEVAEIFVRVNSGGTRLTRSELVFTLLKSRWKGANEEFQKLCDDVNSRGEFETDTDFVIRALLVFSGHSSRVNIERMRDENVMLKFREIFPRARGALASAFDFLTQASGGAIRSYRLLTSGQRADRGYNVVLPIALYFFLRPRQEIPEDQRRRLRRYLYTAIFSRYLVIYVESHIDRLMREIRSSWELGHKEFPVELVESAVKEHQTFDHVSDFFNDSNSLDPLLNILHGGQVDFKTLNARNAPQRDHIFPRSKLAKLEVPDERINHYANMRLLGTIANILKSDDDPVEALADYSEDVLAQEYLIPKRFLNYEKYDEFLNERSTLIANAVDRFLND